MIKKYIKKIVKDIIEQGNVSLTKFWSGDTWDNETATELLTKEILESFVECEKCGCMLKGNTAFRGKSVVKKTFSIYAGVPSQETIYTPYYCKIHAPKGKEQK